MMSLKNELKSRYIESMKNKDTIIKNTIMMVNSAIKQVEVDQRKELSDQDIIAIIQKQIKEKKGAIAEFEQGHRADLVEQTKKEIEILMEYVPKELSEEEIKTMIKDTCEELGDNKTNFGLVMKTMMSKVKGRADGSLVTNLVKEYLAGAK